MSEIKGKVVRGGVFLGAVNVLTQILSIVVNVILAKLLMPEHFGVIALSSAYIGFITMFTNIGFGSSIIYFQEASQEQLSSIYWLNYILSIATYILLIFTAPLAAAYYNSTLLENVIFWASINVLLTPFFIVHSKLLEKKLEFTLLSRITLFSVVFGYLLAVIFAFLGFGVYSLVMQIIGTTFTRLVIVLHYSKWKPSFVLKIKSVKFMLWYSMKYHASSALLFFERNIDYLILGKVFPSNVLGYYSFSYNIMYTPVKKVSYIFSDLLFPSFSSFNNDKNRIINGYFRSIKLISLISFPAMALLSFNSEYIIHSFFGTKWDAAIPIVKILCFAGMIQSVSQVGSVVFTSYGKPELSLYVTIGNVILTVSAIILGSTIGGVLFVAYFLTGVKYISFLIVHMVIYRLINYKISDLLKSLQNALFVVIIIFVFNYLLEDYYFDFNGIWKLILMCVFAFLATLMLNFKFLVEIVKSILSRK